MIADFKHKDITDKIIKGFYEVYNELGDGFLESAYDNKRKTSAMICVDMRLINYEE